MAEIFSVVAGALSVAALFNNCVECFEYIQLGRHFGRDYERCQLHLDVAKTRLGRWGEAVGIYEDSRFVVANPGDRSAQLAHSILVATIDLFKSVYDTSRRYEKTAKPQDLVLYREDDMTPISRGLHNQFRALARSRQKNTSLAKKTAWALYDGKKLERLIDQIKEYMEELEKLFPMETACRGLAGVEIEEIEDEQSLTLLKDAVDGIDDVLSEVVANKVEAISGRNYAREIKAEDHGRVQVGHQYSKDVLGRGTAVTDRTTNSADTVGVKAEARVQIGNRYGDKGVLDD